MSKFSVRKPFTIFVAVILIILLGCISFSKMTADLFPSINLPYMIITTTYAGASPEKVESNVTVPLEKSLLTTENIKTVSSISSENVSMVILQFEDKTNMDSALIEVNNKIDRIKGNWSDNQIGTPTISKINPNMMPVMVASIDVTNTEKVELTDFVNNDILPELERITGIASVSATGLIEEKINIKLNQDKIDELNNKILSNIDSELAKTENNLRKAKKEISTGKNQLEKTTQDQKQQLSIGINQIKDGKEEISNTLTNIEEQENQLKTIEKVLSVALDLANKHNEQEAIDKLEEANTDIDVSGNLKVQIEQKLTETRLGLQQISKTKTELISKKNELDSKEKELQTAENILNSEVDKAYSKLASSETQVNKGLAELETAKEKAYKNASLDGVITQTMISNILTAENFSMPAGYIESTNEKLVIKVGEEFKSLSEIENLKLLSLEIDGVREILLKDVADIEIKNNSDDIYARINGNNGVLLSFQKQSTESTRTVSENIKTAFEKLEGKYENVEFTPLMDQGAYIDIIISSVLQNLLYGAILAILILLLFLRDVKPTIAIALSIPISLTFAITLMYFTGVSINIISLSGLALSVGMLVDNAIVVIENIYRLRNEGLRVKDAAIKGARTVSGAIFASTLTTICVFLPIIFIDGLTRELFMDMALTIAYALLASLIVAITVIPAMTSKLFANSKTKNDKNLSKILNVYERFLKIALKHKVITVMSALVLFIGSIVLVVNMGTAFVPEMEGTQMSLTVNFDEETSIEEGNNISNEIITRLLEIQDIEKIGAIRSNSQLGESTNSISMYIMLNENRKLNNIELEKEITNKTSDLKCELELSTSNMDMSTLGGSGIEVVIKGRDLDKLQEIAIDIEKIFGNIKGIDKVDNGIGETTEELNVKIDKNKALEYGLTVAEIYSTIAKELSTEVESTNITIDNKEYPLVVIKSDNDKLTEENLKDLELQNKNDENEKIAISEISDIEKQDSLNSINRENSERYITITAQIDSEYNIGLVSRDFEKELKNYETPEGYSIELAGENESINQALKDTLLMVALAIIFIYLIMVAQFQSLKLPLIIMFTIPLAFTGGLIALFITGQELSVISMLGFLILAGIIVNNGIVLIDYINQLISSGKNKYDAIIEAGKTRMRPIFMTALTTILGMSTMALGIGMGADMIQALGIVVIGGMIYATILTLLVIPCMYDAFVKGK